MSNATQASTSLRSLRADFIRVSRSLKAVLSVIDLALNDRVFQVSAALRRHPTLLRTLGEDAGRITGDSVSTVEQALRGMIAEAKIEYRDLLEQALERGGVRFSGEW